VKVLCLAISSPRSQVNERRRDVGSLRICRLNAATTAAVSLLRTLTRAVKRECRSTKVAMWLFFVAPNEIAFPMTGDGAVLDFCGPFPDGNGIYDLTMSGYATYQDLAVESDG
jgi:hypothetical protein